MVRVKIAFGSVRYNGMMIHKHKGKVKVVPSFHVGGDVYEVNIGEFKKFLGDCVFYNREPVKEFMRVFGGSVENK